MSDAIKILARDVISRGFGVLQKVTVRRRKFDATQQEITRDVYDTGDGATILLYDPDRGRVLLVRQFRIAAYLATCREPHRHGSGRGNRIRNQRAALSL